MATVAGWMLLGADSALVLFALISIAIAVAVPIHRGGRFLTPSGVFFLASGVFIGVAIYYLRQRELPVSREILRDAAGLALISTIGMVAASNYFAGLRDLSWPEATPRLAIGERFVAPRHFEVKALALFAASITVLVGPLAPLGLGSGFCAVLMLGLAASARRESLGWYGDGLWVAAAFVLPYVWVEFFFSGGGRLMIAGISAASYVGWSLVRPRRWQKLALILSIPVFLLFAGQDRVSRSDNAGSETSVLADGDGLGSVYSPLETFARVLEPVKPFDREQRNFTRDRYGATFVNSLLLPIPRSVWENKPLGFGAELTKDLEPQLSENNHSMATLIQGEWFANFGFLGLALMVPVIGFGLTLLDSVHSKLAWSDLMNPEDWWRATVMLCCVASLAELFWAGTFAACARGGLAAAVAWVLGRLSLVRTVVVGQESLPGRNIESDGPWSLTASDQ